MIPITPTIHLDTPVGLGCGSCGEALDRSVRSGIRALVTGETLSCPQCNVPVDVWSRLVAHVEFGAFGFRFIGVGANLIAFEAEIRRDEPALLDFVALGIPEEASIEQVAMTPQANGREDGCLYPILAREPSVGHPASSGLPVYPTPLQGGSDSTRIAFLIVWTSSGAPDPSTDLLLAAARADQRADRFASVIAANAAMEVALGAAMNTWLEKHKIGKERRERFLADEATYGAQLGVLLPVVCAECGLPPLREDVIAALQRLRRLRNQAAHGDLRTDDIQQGELARGLAAATVGVALADELRSRAGRSAGQPS